MNFIGKRFFATSGNQTLRLFLTFCKSLKNLQQDRLAGRIALRGLLNSNKSYITLLDSGL